jgi:hypothetical protein
MKNFKISPKSITRISCDENDDQNDTSSEASESQTTENYISTGPEQVTSLVLDYGDFVGAIYTGKILNGKPHGQGSLIHTSESRAGNMYVGSFFNGLYHHSGTYTWGMDHLYKGEWDSGDRCGLGTMKYSSGDVYVGEWLDNKWHGYVTLLLFQFHFLKELTFILSPSVLFPNSYGTMKEASGDVYQGEFQYDKRHGRAKYTWVNGNSYEGELRGDKREGHGVMRYAAGE